MNNIANPFVIGRYVSEEYFCDRDEETAFLKKQVENGRDVALISPRRIGKTGLIQHFFHQPETAEQYYTFFIDIYATSSLAEFVFIMGKAIFEELKPKHTVWKERFFQVVKSMRMGFKLDPLSGEPTFEMGLGDIETPLTTLDEIFTYLDTADKPCIVAIDEFQQISNYTEKNVEALLRTKIQMCKQTRFIFSGSKHHMMTNMFNSPSKPFYQSTITMGLNPIPKEKYVAFCQELFLKRGKTVSQEVIETVYNMFNGFTWFMQMMMNELYVLTPSQGNCQPEAIATAIENIILIQKNGYSDLLESLSPKQKLLMIAIAKEQSVTGLTSGSFIKKYKLPSASSVQAAAKPLLDNDLIAKSANRYYISDFFFAHWLRNQY